MQINNYKIPILIIVVTILSSIIHSYSTKSSWETWNDQKAIYKSTINVVGNISANSKDIEQLKILKKEFDKLYGGEMIFAEASDPDLVHEMMKLRKDLDNKINGKIDLFDKEKLVQSCNNLINQISATIEKGDGRKTQLNFIPLIFGLLALMLYYIIKTLFKKKEQKTDRLPTETIDNVKQILSNSSTGVALETFSKILEENKSSRLDDLLMIKSQFNKTKNDRNMGLIDLDEERTSMARINKAILDLLNSLNS